ncbi:MAG: group II intron reverse transcriptase domain-containing protein [Campylobacterales bacterium]|nr:group II intron reverse transcriptase domain-containing protein [Campylobacterales bacterium]
MGKVFEKIITIENALNAFKIIRRGHSENYSMLKFESNLMGNISKILESVKNDSYSVKGYRTLVVREPKERNIYAPYIEDRLVQQMIYSIIEPYLDKKMDEYSCACRVGKGVDYARKKCQRNMRQKDSIWYVKLDIDKYFASIDHEVLRLIIRKHVKDKQVVSLLDKFIGNGFGNKGIPIGNLLSQLFANLYLNELDLFVRHQTDSIHYVRYMDDFICFTKTRTEAVEIKNKILTFVNSVLKLNIDNRKVKIQKVKYGITFLGHKIEPKKCFLSRTKTKKVRKNIKQFIRSKMSIDLHHTFVNLIPKEDYGFLNSVIKLYNNANLGFADKLTALKAFCKKFYISLVGDKFIIRRTKWI